MTAPRFGAGPRSASRWRGARRLVLAASLVWGCAPQDEPAPPAASEPPPPSYARILFSALLSTSRVEANTLDHADLTVTAMRRSGLPAGLVLRVSSSEPGLMSQGLPVMSLSQQLTLREGAPSATAASTYRCLRLINGSPQPNPAGSVTVTATLLSPQGDVLYTEARGLTCLEPQDRSSLQLLPSVTEPLTFVPRGGSVVALVLTDVDGTAVPNPRVVLTKGAGGCALDILTREDVPLALPVPLTGEGGVAQFSVREPPSEWLRTGPVMCDLVATATSRTGRTLRLELPVRFERAEERFDSQLRVVAAEGDVVVAGPHPGAEMHAYLDPRQRGALVVWASLAGRLAGDGGLPSPLPPSLALHCTAQNTPTSCPAPSDVERLADPHPSMAAWRVSLEPTPVDDVLRFTAVHDGITARSTPPLGVWLERTPLPGLQVLPVPRNRVVPPSARFTAVLLDAQGRVVPSQTCFGLAQRTSEGVVLTAVVPEPSETFLTGTTITHMASEGDRRALAQLWVTAREPGVACGAPGAPVASAVLSLTLDPTLNVRWSSTEDPTLAPLHHPVGMRSTFVRFHVFNAAGQPAANAHIRFALEGATGDAQVRETGLTDATGMVVTRVTAGTDPGVLRVVATPRYAPGAPATADVEVVVP